MKKSFDWKWRCCFIDKYANLLKILRLLGLHSAHTASCKSNIHCFDCEFHKDTIMLSQVSDKQTIDSKRSIQCELWLRVAMTKRQKRKWQDTWILYWLWLCGWQWFSVSGSWLTQRPSSKRLSNNNFPTAIVRTRIGDNPVGNANCRGGGIVSPGTRSAKAPLFCHFATTTLTRQTAATFFQVSYSKDRSWLGKS